MSEITDKDISVYVELDLAGSESPIELNMDLLRKIYRTVVDETFRTVLFNEEKKPHTIKVVRLIRGMTDLQLKEAVAYAKTVGLLYPLNILDAHEKGLIFIDFKNKSKQ